MLTSVRQLSAFEVHSGFTIRAICASPWKTRNIYFKYLLQRTAVGRANRSRLDLFIVSWQRRDAELETKNGVNLLERIDFQRIMLRWRDPQNQFQGQIIGQKSLKYLHWDLRNVWTFGILVEFPFQQFLFRDRWCSRCRDRSAPRKAATPLFAPNRLQIWDLALRRHSRRVRQVSFKATRRR